MSRKRTIWECSICYQGYDSEKEANSCESHHIKLESLKINNIFFKKLGTSFCHPVDINLYRRFPYKIRIKLSDDFGDFATYILERIGHRGV